MIDFLDRDGIAFADYRKHLPASSHDFGKIKTIKDSEVLAWFHRTFHVCFACGRKRREIKLEAHHIFGGSKGRSDEATNLAMLCFPCHENVNTRLLPIGMVLWRKWVHDRENTSWPRLALLRRSFLPSLMDSESVLRECVEQIHRKTRWRS